ncbi:OmpA family protein (plasmid) [Azospirillum ramasamyi]|uniref:OmpA family protein n=2 Tax=Azospirillum ramasamyi TaxID=682998 RepID=A0A2U9S9P5_9PROT|nr:OmpA family protein [Azospirillum ramasamyi]
MLPAFPESETAGVRMEGLRMGTVRVLRPVFAGLALLLACGSLAAATEPTVAPTTTEDFIRALRPDTPPADGKPRTRGLALGTGAAAEPAAPPPAPASPAAAPAPAAAKPKAAPRISFQVEFAFNSAELTPKATGILDELGRALTSPELAAYRFQLTGHTDGVGNPDYNLALSKRRAASVRDYLTRSFGVSPGRLVAIGRGAQQLLDPANPASDANRRVEIVNLGS